ncbi:Helicase C-terminal [Penicillium cf. griseofulvum]|uniref:Helicase C-terminal n=1 Tax=Penicillium cf. griseofulvum TaxID=2972120 RepID=A0A9W9N079_9EURO|nr:Helicase C-terminal [Penicillium cf. griseofulvum]KAJ5422221.1 Helicase C-terminal [Penicillium cf. griseofulvum]KAJ5428405.1 Helicase C-terminal [Penicillium cf. griseofulvum]
MTDGSAGRAQWPACCTYSRRDLTRTDPNPSQHPRAAGVTRKPEHVYLVNISESKQAAILGGSVHSSPASMKDLDASAARLAGCLGFQTPASLRALFSSNNAATKRVIVDYIADRQAGFGIASLPDFPTKFRSIKAPTVIEAVDHAGRYTQVLLDDKPPTLASPNVTESNLFDIRQMWWNRQYMLTRVDDLAANSQLRIAPFHFDAFKTFLAWKVLIYFYTGFHRRRNFVSANWHNVPAVAPTHVTPKANPVLRRTSCPAITGTVGIALMFQEK